MIVTLRQLLELEPCIDTIAIVAYAQRWPREHWQGDAPAVELPWLLSPAALEGRVACAQQMAAEHGAELDRLPRDWTPEVANDVIDRLAREHTEWVIYRLMPAPRILEAQRRAFVFAVRGVVADDAEALNCRVWPDVLRQIPEDATTLQIRSWCHQTAQAAGRSSKAAQLEAACKPRADLRRLVRDVGTRLRACGIPWRDQVAFYEQEARGLCASEEGSK